MNVLWESMIAEMRRLWMELDSRRHFTKPKDAIETSREFVAQWTIPREAEDPETVASKNAMNLRKAADHDLFEVG